MLVTFDTFLIAAVLAAIATWATLSWYVLRVQDQRDRARATVGSVLAALTGPAVVSLPVAQRVDSIRALLHGASRELIMAAATDPDTPSDAADTLAAYLMDRWGSDVLERDAGPHRSRRDKWRRMKALQILTRSQAPRSIELLADAVRGDDSDVATVALSLLGTSEHPQAADVLFDALKRRAHPASRVAVQIDRSPQHLAARLTPLLHDSDAVLRLWAATLLGRYIDVEGAERELANAAEDEDPRVRKAAVQSLGQVGESLAAVTALRLLNDPIAYVRATAARAIGKLDREDLAEDVAALLGDPDWWVRFAAKECLESMGADVWPVLARALDHSDRFVRNGAAEVFQNLGVLDSFIVMEAASDNPAPHKIAMLRRIASAGGVRLTDSLVERVGPTLGPRVRDLLSVMGLQDVGAA
jgi:HEAT repeat protein